MLRVGSRVPVVMPQRMTESLCDILGGCGTTVWLAAHFNHPAELSEKSRQGVERLLRHGVPVVNQSVLLKGVNDDAETLAAMQALRTTVDSLERKVGNARWPLPKYRDMLFLY
jgi:lysine 2,3-aminomutase